MVYFVAHRVPMSLCETENQSISTSGYNYVFALLSVTPLNKKKAISNHVIKSL